ncbi:hypothetical protein J6590_091268 [Homalodisca vitripennis]|nr:hypothetical protein J6590_091268 [Homalodisca vitripennis]
MLRIKDSHETCLKNRSNILYSDQALWAKTVVYSEQTLPSSDYALWCSQFGHVYRQNALAYNDGDQATLVKYLLEKWCPEDFTTVEFQVSDEFFNTILQQQVGS